MTDYSKTAELLESAKENAVKSNSVDIFAESVSKLINISDNDLLNFYEDQVDIYSRYVDHLKETSEDSDELAFFKGLVQKNLECIAYIKQNSPLHSLCKVLKCSGWTDYEISRMVVFQEQASSALNIFFDSMEKMTEIEKYIRQGGGMVGEYNPNMFNIKRSVN